MARVQTQLSVTREDLPKAYAEAIVNNPLLGRIEGSCRSIGWTDQEIRTLQLLAAVNSNASISERLRELELLLGGRNGG